MKTLGSRFLSFLVYLMLAESVIAHVVLDYPTGGESFVFGETVNIQWHISISHPQENWDLYFSSDSGVTWEAIKLNMNVLQLNYQWTVPETVTDKARIRIDMDNTGTDYSDRSGVFIIQNPLNLDRLQEETPKTFSLYANYPNPFNPTTTISYELSVTSHIELTIYNQLGQEIRTLVSRQQQANYYQIQWDGRDNAGKQVVSGIYVYRLTGDSFSQSRKMVLLK